MAELGVGYISIVADTSKVAGQIKKAFGNAGANQIGENLGSTISGSLGKALKVGAGTIGVAAGGILAASVAKGMGRLTAIEGAKAKLSGLGSDAAAVAGIMDNALASVKGTAHGLGEAATTSAMLVAAGVKQGEELETTLTTVGDVAAISGRTMADVGTIFSSVAARGKLQGDDMLQLMSSGVPVLQLLAKELGVTSAEVSDMVSKGEIDFATFERAMRAGMGGAAQEMGKTFEGSLANMQAAMGRFGATLLSPAFAASPALFSAIGSSFDAIDEALQGPMAKIGDALTPALEQLAGVIETRVAPKLGELAGKAGEAGAALVEKAVDPALWERIGQVFSDISATASTLWPSIESLGKSFLTISQNISVSVWQALTATLNAAAPIIENALVPLVEHVARFAESNPAAVQAMVTAFAGFKVLSTLTRPVGAAVKYFGNLAGSVKFLKAAFAGQGLAGGLVNVMAGFSSANPIIAAMGKTVASLTKGLTFLPKVFGPVLSVVKLINPWVAGITAVTAGLTWFFTQTETGRGIWDGFVGALQGAWGWLTTTFATIGEVLSQAMLTAQESLFTVWASISETLANIGEVFAPLGQALSTAFSAGFEIVKDIVATAWLVIVDLFTGNWSRIPETLAAGWASITSRFTEAVSSIGGILAGWVATSWERFTALKDGAVAKVAELVSNAVMKFHELRSAVMAKVAEIVSHTVTKFVEMRTRVITTVQELPGRIKGFFASAGSWLVNAGRNILNGLWNGLKEKWSAVTSWLSGLKNTVLSAFSDATSAASTRISAPGHAGGGRVGSFATGGRLPVTGPGTGVTDGILGVDAFGMPTARVDAGEWVINRRSSAKYHDLLAAINADALPKHLDLGGIQALAEGGKVTAAQLLDFAHGKAVNGNQANRSLEGAPYVWAGGHPVWGDCSGTMSVLAALVHGIKNIAGRYFATGDQASVLSSWGWTRGTSSGKSAFEVGLFNGGPWGGHTAGTVYDDNGRATNLEMGGGRGNGQINGAAAGSRDPSFTDRLYINLPTGGGSLNPDSIISTSTDDMTVAMGNTRKNIDWKSASNLASEWEKREQKRSALKTYRLNRFATGGRLPVTGPGTGVTDGILGVDAFGMPTARVDAGEWVINRRMSEKHHDVLAAINADRFATGGRVSGSGVFNTDGLTVKIPALESLVSKLDMDALGASFATSINEKALFASALGADVASGNSLNAYASSMDFGEGISLADRVGKIFGADAIGSVLNPVNDAWTDLEDAAVAQVDAADAVTQAEKALIEARKELAEASASEGELSVKSRRRIADAEEDLAEARAKGKPEQIAKAEKNLQRAREDANAELEKSGSDEAKKYLAARENVTNAENDLAKAHGTVKMAAASAGQAQVAMALQVVETAIDVGKRIGQFINKIISSIMQARVIAAQVIGEHMEALGKQAELVAKQREQITGLSMDFVKAQIEMAAAARNRKLVELDGVAAVAKAGIDLASAQAAFEDQRKVDAKSALDLYADLTLGIDSLRWSLADGLKAASAETAAWTDETHARYSELLAAQISMQIAEQTAAKANLEAIQRQGLATLDALEASMNLQNAAQQLALMTKQNFGMDQAAATVGERIAKLMEEKAELQAKRGENWWRVFSWHATGASTQAKKRQEEIDREIAELSARPEVNDDLRDAIDQTNKDMSKIGFMGFVGQADMAKDMLKNGRLGDASRSLDRYDFEKSLADIDAAKQKLELDKARFRLDTEYRTAIDQADTGITAMEAERDSHLAAAKGWRAETDAVRQAYMQYSDVLLNNSQEMARIAQTQLIIQMPAEKTAWTSEEVVHMVEAAGGRIQSAERRIDALEPKTNSTDVSLSRRG